DYISPIVLEQLPGLGTVRGRDALVAEALDGATQNALRHHVILGDENFHAESYLPSRSRPSQSLKSNALQPFDRASAKSLVNHRSMAPRGSDWCLDGNNANSLQEETGASWLARRRRHRQDQAAGNSR